MDPSSESSGQLGLAIVYVVAGICLLGCNFFFVMSEFAFVKLRDSQVAALALAGDPRAGILRHIKAHLDEYLSVVQVGITGATIGMGVVIDEGIGQVVERGFASVGWSGDAAHIVSVILAFSVATYMTIVSSELMPKAIALRSTERVALIAARPMRILHRMFYLPIIALNRSAKLLMRIIGFRDEPKDVHSEDELRIILGQSQDGGIMPFRRLLLFENLFDLGGETVKDAMRPLAQVVSIPADGTRETMVERVVAHGYSRYPLVAKGADPTAPPAGIVHAKDVLARLAPGAVLSDMARPFLTFPVDAPLERALGEFQRSRNHLAVVVDAQGRWVGIISFEDVIEEIVGSIEDEFEREQPLHLDELLTAERIVLDIPASSVEEAIGQVMRRVPLADLPAGVDTAGVVRQLLDRERGLSTYVGRGIAIPHVRIEGLPRPVAIFARVTPSIVLPNRRDSARFLFILLVPAGAQRLHLRLLARIAQIAESDYLLDRLGQAANAQEIQETVAAGDRLTTG